MRLDIDIETVYQQGNYFLIAIVCCQNRRHRSNLVEVLTCDIFQGQILITINETEYRFTSMLQVNVTLSKC